MNNVIKKNTRYEIESVEQLKEILEVAKKQGYKSAIREIDFDEVHHLYIHEFSMGWDKESTELLYNYPLVTWKSVKKQTALANYPTDDFKISLKGMSSAERSTTLNWLKEVAISRGLDFSSLEVDCNYFWVDGIVYKKITFGYAKKYFQEDETPELTLTFETTVKDFKITNKKTKKELQLEELIDKLSKQLEEAEKELSTIKEGE